MNSEHIMKRLKESKKIVRDNDKIAKRAIKRLKELT